MGNAGCPEQSNKGWFKYKRSEHLLRVTVHYFHCGLFWGPGFWIEADRLVARLKDGTSI